MLVNTKPGDSVDYYDSAQQFLKEDTVVEIDIHIVGLERKFRIRALTLGQMELINQKSTIDGKLDSALFTVNTIIEGVVRPKFTKTLVDDMLASNGEIMRELSEQIWQLGRVTKSTFEKYVNALSTK